MFYCINCCSWINLNYSCKLIGCLAGWKNSQRPQRRRENRKHITDATSIPVATMTAPRVLISDELSDKAVEIFQSRGIQVDVKVGLKPDELKAIIGDYDGLAIRSNTKVTKDVLSAAKKLKIIGRAGIGVDNVDIPAASAKGIVVENTPLGNSITTAEHSVAMLMSLARQIPLANSSTHAGKWEKSKFMGVELYAKTLGVVGCGNIGAIVANRCGQGLKMKVDSWRKAALSLQVGHVLTGRFSFALFNSHI